MESRNEGARIVLKKNFNANDPSHRWIINDQLTSASNTDLVLGVDGKRLHFTNP